MIRRLSCLLFAALAATSYSQIGRFAGEVNSCTVQAQIVGPYFQVQAKINGKTVTLIVDTGAGLSVITTEAAKRIGIEGGVSMRAGGAGGKSVPARLVTVKSFVVGSAIVEEDKAIVIDLPEVLQCDGLVGFSFLRHFATTFDYSTAKLTFAKTGSHSIVVGESAVPLVIEGNIPHLKGSLDGIEGLYSIDTGAGSVLAVHSPFAKSNNMNSKYPNRISRIIGKGVGGFVMGDRVSLKSVILGGFEFKNAPGALAYDGSGALSRSNSIGNVGADLIRRLIVTFDYPAQKAFLRKSPMFDLTYDVDRSGLFCDYEKGKWIVANVAAGSGASAAGIKDGDEVLSIDGIEPKTVHPLNFGKPLRKPSGSIIGIRFRRNGTDILASVKLTD
jgi:clan AA aspartic protease (TIGR02281 family)